MILVDGDLIVYRCGFAVEKTKYLVQAGEKYSECDNAKEAKAVEGVIWSRKEVEPEGNAIYLVKQVLADIVDRYADSCGHLAVYLSPSVGNFRERIAARAKYKGNRDTAVRPTHSGAIRDYLCSEYGAVIAEGQEADDSIGIGLSADKGSVAVSFDKDLWQVPGLHYDWVKKEERTVSKKQGALSFYTQVLAGDATDNVPGIEGVGPAKAAKILEGVTGEKDAWRRCLDAYIKAYGDDGPMFAKETAQLVYVRRKEGEIWQPPAK